MSDLSQISELYRVNVPLSAFNFSSIARRVITPVFPAGYETQLQPDSCQYSVLNLNYAEQVYQLRAEPFLER
jgi:hypothetical protein